MAINKKTTPVPLINKDYMNARLQRGLGLLRALFMIPATLITVLIVAVVFYEGRKAYWDYQVREMCGKDGGVKIFEHIVVSAEQAAKLPKVGNFLGVASEKLVKPWEPAFTRTRRVVIRDESPTVIRYEVEIVRRLDQRVIGKVISYGRGGGDFPSHAEPSNFHCPEYVKLYQEIHAIYQIKG